MVASIIKQREQAKPQMTKKTNTAHLHDTTWGLKRTEEYTKDHYQIPGF